MPKKSAHAPVTPAITVLEQAAVPYTTHTYAHDPDARAEGLSYGQEAALALGVPAELVFKTLLANVEGHGLVVGIVPVDAQLDLKALAHVFGAKKAVLATPQEAQRSSGYVVGGISPLGQRKPLPTVLDASATALERLYVSGGRRGFDIALTPANLVTLTQASTAPIATSNRHR